MFRALTYLVGLTVATVLYGGSAVVFGVLGVKAKPGGIYDWLQRRWSRLILRSAGVSVRLVGVDHIPDRPVVFVSNHQSWFDILALVATLSCPVRFVAKKELAKVPIFGRAMKSAGHIIIDRQKRQAAFGSYEQAANEIRKGISALVFAEGTRSRTGELLPFKKGPFVLAIAAQVPVLPVYCANTFDILPKGSMRVRPRPITLFFGEPISTDGLGYEKREELLARSREVIEGFRDGFRVDAETVPT